MSSSEEELSDVKPFVKIEAGVHCYILKMAMQIHQTRQPLAGGRPFEQNGAEIPTDLQQCQSLTSTVEMITHQWYCSSAFPQLSLQI